MSDRYDAIDDATAEALLRGEAVKAELQPLAEAVTTLRTAPHRSGRPSDELARRMASGDFATEVPAVRIRRKRRRARLRLAALSLRAKIATLVMIGLTALTGMAAAGALPAPAQQGVKDIVESITPIEVPGPGTDDGSDGGDSGGNGDESDPGADAEEELEGVDGSGGSGNGGNHGGDGKGKEPGLSTEPTPGQSGGGREPTKPPKYEESPTDAPTSSPTPSPSPTPTPTPTTASTPEPMPEATPTPIVDLNL